MMTANGEVQTREDATVFVKELELFVTVMLLQKTPVLFSLGKLWEEPVQTLDSLSRHPWPSILRMKRTETNSFVMVADQVFL